MGAPPSKRVMRRIARQLKKSRQVGFCQICSWHGPLTKHHAMFPRSKYRNHPLHEKLVIFVCWPCHEMINTRFHQQECRYDGGGEWNSNSNVRTVANRRIAL